MMTLHGADIYLRTPITPELPLTIGAFTLIFIASRGTRVYPGPAPDVETVDWPQCRYFCEEEATDAQVDALVTHITGLGWQWTKLQKLFKIDGVNGFSQPY